MARLPVLALAQHPGAMRGAQAAPLRLLALVAALLPGIRAQGEWVRDEGVRWGEGCRGIAG